MVLHDLPGEGEAESGTSFCTGTNFVGAPEAIEDVGQCSGVDPNAGVSDGDAGVCIVGDEGEVDLSVIGVLDGIVQQDYEEAPQVRGSAGNRNALLREGNAEVQSLLVSGGCELIC